MPIRTPRSSEGDPLGDEEVAYGPGGLGIITSLTGPDEVEEESTAAEQYLYVPDLSSRTGYSVHRVRAQATSPPKPKSGRRIGFRR